VIELIERERTRKESAESVDHTLSFDSFKLRFKLSCDSRFQRAIIVCVCVYKASMITLKTQTHSGNLH